MRIAVLFLAACTTANANVPLAENSRLGSLSVAHRSHQGISQANLFTATGIGGCVCDEGRRSRSTGKERDNETGLDWMKSRYFNGAQGRFTSPDKPFADQFPEDPQSWNLYSYVRNNPLKMVDEDGQSATLVGALGGAIIGGGVAAWRGESVWKGVASGAISGAVAGSVIDTGGASLGVLALSGAAAGLTGGAVSRGLNGEGTTLKQAAIDAAVGGTVGVVMGVGGKAIGAALSRSGAGAEVQAVEGISAPKPSPNFVKPTNTPQQPPVSLPDGHNVRVMGPTEQYPNGYWVQTNKSGQPVNPATGKPTPNVSKAVGRSQTHVPLPPEELK